MDLNVSGHRALITGASKGIGAATARVLAEEGCALRLAARDGRALDGLAARAGDSIALLASDRSGHTSATVLTVDGGRTAAAAI